MRTMRSIPKAEPPRATKPAVVPSSKASLLPGHAMYSLLTSAVQSARPASSGQPQYAAVGTEDNSDEPPSSLEDESSDDFDEKPQPKRSSSGRQGSAGGRARMMPLPHRKGMSKGAKIAIGVGVLIVVAVIVVVAFFAFVRTFAAAQLSAH